MQKKKRVITAQTLHKPLLAAVAAASVLFLLAMTFTTPIIGWFKTHLFVENPAQLTNFTVRVQYRYGSSDSYKTLSAGSAISVTPDNINTLQIRVGYCGVATHYLRVSFHGGFYNKNTGTYLPMNGDSQSSLFAVTSTNTNWVKSGDYMYYKSRLLDKTSTTNLAVLNMAADTSSWANKSNYQDYAGELYVLVDAVQCNRIQEFWGISAPPSA